MNTILIIGLLALAAILVYFIFFKKYTAPPTDILDQSEDIYKIEYLVQKVGDEFNAVLKTNYSELNLNRYEIEKSEKNKSTLRSALKLCAFGNIGYKLFVKEYIKDMLQSRFHVTEETIDQVIPFHDAHALTTMEKFDILLYLYRQQFDRAALEELITRYKLDTPKEDERGDIFFEVDSSVIRILYQRHQSLVDTLTFGDHLNIVAQRIYQKLKGHGVVDELCDMTVDGVNCGTSGIPESFYSYGMDMSYGAKEGELPLTGYNSVWIMYKGKKIRMSFLGFESNKELQRVVKNIYRYNDPGMLSADKGYIVNCLQNGSRITVSRPSMCEEWVFFLRNFDTSDSMTLYDMYPFEGNEKLIQLAKYVVLGEQNIAITGSQGCGKTTFMLNLIQFMRSAYSIRVEEMAAELRIRKMYPRRNIVSFTETDTVSGQQIVNFMKKTDADICLLGEVAEAALAAIGIQMGQVGSRQLIFTHHAGSVPSLIKAFRDNLTLAGGYNNEKIAEETVASVLNFNIHISMNVYGRRIVERITEIIPRVEEDYCVDSLQEATNQFYYRMTDRQLFNYKDLVVYDHESLCYKFVGEISQEGCNRIETQLTPEERVLFHELLNQMQLEAA